MSDPQRLTVVPPMTSSGFSIIVHPHRLGSPLWRPGVVFLLLALVSAAVYLPHVNAPFLYDDISLIAANPQIRSLGNLGRFFMPGYWNEVHEGTKGVYRPLREVAFTLMFAVAGTREWAYSLVSFAFHLGVVFFVYSLGRRLLKGEVAPAVAALLFAVHPVHIEAVLWRKNLGELMCACFALFSFLLFLRWAQGWGARRALLLYWGSAACYVLALLCKETAVALPLVFLLYAVFTAGHGDRRALVVRILPFFAIAIAYVLFQFWCFRLVPDAIHGMRREPDEALWLRPALVLKTLAVYHRLLLWPVQLSAKHHFLFPIGYTGYEVRWHLLGFLLLATLMVWGFVHWRRGTPLIAWIIAFLLPASNIIPFRGRPIGEQRAYLASVGFCLLVGAAVGAVTSRREVWRRRFALVAGCAVVAVLINLILTVQRARLCDNWDWFWHDLIIKSPVQAEHHAYFGKVYFDRGLVPQAESHALIALTHEPENASALELLGLCAGDVGEHREAIQYFEEALKKDPKRQNAWRCLGLAHFYLNEFDRAVAPLRRALDLHPFDSATRLHLAAVYQELGQPEAALAEGKRVLEQEPNNADAHFLVAMAYERMGQWTAAVEALNRAVQCQPGNPLFLTELGKALLEIGERDRAAEALRAALRIAPAYVPAREALRRAEGG